MTYTKENLDRLFRETIERVHPNSWPPGCGWELDVSGASVALVVFYEEHTRHWADANDGGCTDYCMYQQKTVRVPL